MTSPTVLGIDTSGSYCGAALYKAGDVVAALFEDMVRGQAERLFPMIEEVLQEAETGWADLDAIGVGVGPGNFTGIRISVSAARGLSISLGKPAIGVTLLDALAEDAQRPALLVLSAPREQIYASVLTETGLTPPALYDMETLPAPPEGSVLIGTNSQDLAARLNLTAAPSAYAPASAIARIAARRIADDHAPPAPLYIRPADAAPPKDTQPTIRA